MHTPQIGCVHIKYLAYALFVSLGQIRSKNSFLALGFGLLTYFSYLGSSLGYIGLCFGLSSLLGSTHEADNFGRDLISCHWDWGGLDMGRNDIRCLHHV